MTDEKERIIRILQLTTRNLLSSFSSKAELLKNCSMDVKKLIKEGVDYAAASETANKFFKCDTVPFLAIDGTQSQDEELNLLVFYAGAYGYKGQMRFGANGITIPKNFEGSSPIDVSSAIPIHEEDISRVVGKMTESGMEVDTAKLPSSLMQLAEYYMGIREIEKDPTLKVLFFDRMPSIDMPHLVGNSIDFFESNESILLGMDTPYGAVSLADLELSRMLHPNEKLKLPASRSQLIKYRAIEWILGSWGSDQDLSNADTISFDQLLGKIGAKPGRVDKLSRDLWTFDKRFSIFSSPEHKKGKYGKKYIRKSEVDPKLKDYWKRVFFASMQIADHIFNTKENEHPLMYDNKNCKPRWITAEDLNFLTLVMIYALLRKAWEGNILIIGLVKDIGAMDLIKSVIPVLRGLNLLSFENPLPNFNSDRMLLQVNSIVNGKETVAPWSTFEYDSCFKTIVPESGSESESKDNFPTPFYNHASRANPSLSQENAGNSTFAKGESTTQQIPNEPKPACRNNVNGAFKNLISMERLFVKSYVQLWSSRSNPNMRSHVFAYDRPCYPEFDKYGDFVLTHRDGNVNEDIIPIFYFKKENPLSNLVMAILHSLAQEVVPECLGHNYPLFLADKKAKIFFKTTRNAYLSAVSLEISKSQLGQQSLFNRRFRDFRGEIESARMRGASS